MSSSAACQNVSTMSPEHLSAMSPVYTALWQQEVIHPANAPLWIPQAHGHAAAQNGGQGDLGIAGDIVLALDHMDPLAGALGDVFNDHSSGPKTASIFSFSVAVVKGLTR